MACSEAPMQDRLKARQASIPCSSFRKFIFQEIQLTRSQDPISRDIPAGPCRSAKLKILHSLPCPIDCSIQHCMSKSVNDIPSYIG